MQKNKLSFKRLTALVTLIILIPRFSFADTIIATVEAPTIQQTQSAFFSVGMETFNSRTNATPFTSNFSTQVGSYPLVSGLSGDITITSINSATLGDRGPVPFLYGGAYATGAYPKDAATLSLATPVNYFGLWVSALNSGNVITIYRDKATADANINSYLYTFNVSSLTSIIGSSSASNLYYGNPNWASLGSPGTYASQQDAVPGEPYAFVNFYDTTPNAKFSYITLTGGGFESDNWTVGNYSAISGTNPSAPNITSNATTSDLGSNVNPKFDGGTLKSSASSTVASNITVTSNDGTIDAFGFNPTYSGVISNATVGTAGDITFQDTASGSTDKKVTLTGVNTFTGATNVNSGVTLALSGNGSIATSSGVCNSGTLDISGTNSGSSLIDLTCTGNTVLGAKVLTLTGPANTTYGGVASGTGGISFSGGTKTLTADNTYTGATTVASGATLKLTTGSISASSGVCNNGTLDISGTGTGSSLVDLTCTGNTVLGSKVLTLTGPADTTYGGVASGTGGISFSGGIKTLEAVNTYTGATTVATGATLKLTTGSIAASSGVNNNGTLDISATTSGASIKNITGSGATTLGSRTLTLTNGSGTYSGAISGSGGLKLVTGSQTLTGNNTYTGTTEVNHGANLIISSASALGSGLLDLVGTATVSATISTTTNMTISNNIRVTGDPTFNVSPGTTTTHTGVISGIGDVVVTGGGTLELTGINTYTLDTTINAGSTLALVGAGSISGSGTDAGATGVFNNGTFSIVAAANSIALGENYTQTGLLRMNWYQTIAAAGALSLSGTLSLNNTNGAAYSAGRFTLLTSTGRSGTFSTFDSSNLSNRFTYTLGYDANNVFLDLLSNGPSADDTQQSLLVNASALRNIYTLQNTVLSSSFSYDCAVFDKNNVCVSAGGRNTYINDSNGLNNNSALLILAYRPQPNFRIGAYAENSLSLNNVGRTVNLGNSSPLVGLFGVWNERLDGTGLEIKLSAAYGQKKASVTRLEVGGSEPGNGSSELLSQGAQVIAKYGFGVAENIIVSPHIGVRYTQNNMGGYTEGTSTTVAAPLTYSALNTNATTALAGIGASYRITPKVILFAKGDLEIDANTANGTYSANGVDGLTSINFNATSVKTRASGTFGAFYDMQGNHRLSVTGIYREEPFEGKSSTSLMANYTVGL